MRRAATVLVALATTLVAAPLPAGAQGPATAGTSALTGALTGTPTGTPTVSTAGAATARTPLTNLDHLDWLSVGVTPPQQAGHTTYRLRQDPEVGVLWTYAEPNADGSYRPVGGGTYDEATDTWGQGAFNADDITRAAVVYLRHWQATGDRASRRAAYDLLRGVTYLQTASGPDAGNVVLWMQPDGTLNPSAEPVELPDPSDSDASYWLARTIWALGEGYAAFEEADPAFARFLRERLELSLRAVDRQVLDRYGEYLTVDGRRTPAWLVADGADASAEAVLGLAAYVDAGGSPRAKRALARLSEGIAGLAGDGDARTWPFGGARPWALSRSMWHGWGAQMPAALARAADTLDRPRLAAPARTDSFTFDPWLLTSGGPDNGRMPTRGDRSQIAYGADSRLQSLLATGDLSTRTTGRLAANRLAGVVAAWYFGANPAGTAMYDPATGRTFDGINADGTVNANSGAESTIHGLLSMLALDAHPAVAAQARTATVQQRVGTLTVEAEDAALSGNATALTPESLWTGESLFSGTGLAALRDGSRARFALPRHGRALVLPVLDLRPGSSAVTTYRAGGTLLGRTDAGAVGRQGASPAPGALLPVTLDRPLPAGAGTLTATTRGRGAARLDALMIEPLVSRLVLRGNGRATALLRSASTEVERARVNLPGRGPVRVESYDGRGHLLAVRTTTSPSSDTVRLTLPAGGFTVVQRTLHP